MALEKVAAGSGKSNLIRVTSTAQACRKGGSQAHEPNNELITVRVVTHEDAKAALSKLRIDCICQYKLKLKHLDEAEDEVAHGSLLRPPRPFLNSDLHRLVRLSSGFDDRGQCQLGWQLVCPGDCFS